MKLVNERWLTKEDIYNIPKEDTPLLVISDAVQSIVAARIKSLQNGHYNHLMWLINIKGKNVFASQDTTFKLVELDKYVDNKHRLKFWYDKEWTNMEKVTILSSIQSYLELPWYKKMYDPLQIFGIRIGAKWLQMPGTRICSDFGDQLGLVDFNYQLSHPSPPEVNRWLKKHSYYEVYGRYTSD